ncbi:hypothetical protein MMPV_007680 [Pyropia vietnamensis]
MCATNDLGLPRADLELSVDFWAADAAGGSGSAGGYASDGVGTDAFVGWGASLPGGALPSLGGVTDAAVLGSDASSISLPYLGGKLGPASPTAIAVAAEAAVRAAATAADVAAAAAAVEADPFAPLAADEPQSVVVCADLFDVTRMPQYCPPPRVATTAAGGTAPSGTPSNQGGPVTKLVAKAAAPARIPPPAAAPAVARSAEAVPAPVSVVAPSPPPARAPAVARAPTAARVVPVARTTGPAAAAAPPAAAGGVTPAKARRPVKVEDSSFTSRLTPPPSTTTALGRRADGITAVADADVDACNAVESARQEAEALALAETEARRKAKKRKRLAAEAAAGGGAVASPALKRRRAAGGAGTTAAADDNASVCGAASSDESDVDVDIPADATAKQVRYLKRLQKNRDSAFTSRIRRRLYTGLLEQSLTAVEAEKERLRAKVSTLDTSLHALEAELAVYRAAAAPRLGKQEGELGMVYEAA